MRTKLTRQYLQSMKNIEILFSEIKYKNFINSYLIPSMISCIKALLEQGDPCIAPLWNTPLLRWIFGCYLCIAIYSNRSYK